ncbi:DNA gyrase subunit A, partial [Bellilinea sp.]|uniref:DNA gyrase subunit A n=1 Tax=Bellilinea sp. TaxID=2838785 RepID=UPI002ADE1070
DNFDGSLREPVVLPARLPNLLLNGSAGIAVGMATNVPPHNLRELTDALIYLIDHYDQMDEVSIEDLMRFLPGPDFPTGGVIVGQEAIRQMYTTGRGRLTVRGQAHIEEMRGGRYQIVITEIPFQVNKTSLIERIAELAREGRLDAISDLRDESDRRGMSIVIELRRGAQPRKVLNQLYKYTPLQTTFGAHLLALVDNEPRLLTLKRALQIYIEHRIEVITRRSQFELEKARQRAHILEGLLIALANLDEVIQTIRQSPDVETARERLITRFKLTEMQAQAILDMQLRRLAALERQKIEEEHRSLLERIAYLEDLLASPNKILDVIKTDLQDVSAKYADARRTLLLAEASETFNEEDLVADEHVLIMITQRGYIKRVAARAFRTQMRGGRGVTGQNLKEEDETLMVIPARTLNTILFFSDKGKVYSEKVYQIPDAGRTDRGIPMVNVLSLGADEKITAAVAVTDFQAAQYCTMATVKGRVKRVALAEFASVRPSGLIAIGLEDGDELGWARITSGSDDIILVTAQGKAVRFNENEVRVMGRQAAGVSGVRLSKDDQLAGMEVVQPNAELLVVTERGFGKRTPLSEYPPKSRNTGGVTTINQKNLQKIGKIAAVRVVEENDDITLVSANGLIIRMKVKDISRTGRSTRGVRLMVLADDDSVTSVARISARELQKAEEEKNGENGT